MCCRGLYIGKYPPLGGGGMSTDVMGKKNMKREEKGRKGKENEKKGSKRVK
jgi:hypothetical protein